jgi:hypothetical protein
MRVNHHVLLIEQPRAQQAIQAYLAERDEKLSQTGRSAATEPALRPARPREDGGAADQHQDRLAPGP